MKPYISYMLKVIKLIRCNYFVTCGNKKIYIYLNILKEIIKQSKQTHKLKQINSRQQTQSYNIIL